ncbi:LabA-like NYN domain-containing protein [Crenalkalicoccus roseus]|uniref:LabA-like NYN domain-containing protein n=1 Tax=Crenalkalicoccus roseus TaxID=1485588 RepID=UPI00108089BD|nr:NYN domain-containing protein [Crenalkalicoccus roseus]
MAHISKATPLHSERIERLALFIDGANLYAASRTLGFDVDYKNLLAHFRRQGYLIRAYYYTALLETEEYSPLRPLVDWLGYNGYAVVTKPAKEFTDATGRRRVKGSVDIEMAVDVLDLASRLDHAVIFSGDGDLRRLVEAVQRRGVRVTVVSTIRTQPAMIADELRRQADAFLDLADLAEHVTRRQVEPRPRTAPPRPAAPRATPAEPFRETAGDLPE